MFRNWLRPRSSPVPFANMAPEQPFTAIGDIHGRADLLSRFLDSAPDHQIVCVGDYVDRGDQSAEVLQILAARRDIVCLSGNHEEMMLGFIADPVVNGRRWLRNGGLQTLASYGIGAVTENSRDATMKAAAERLRAAMGEPLIDWLRTLPTYWQTGNVAVVHAGADPAVPITDQTIRTLHWGHEEFQKKRRSDDTWVIHGHTIVDAAVIEDGRIAIDTGAYATGRLTAAHVVGEHISFETVQMGDRQAVLVLQ